MRRHTGLPTDEIAARYKAGESTCILARAYGVSVGTVERRLKAAGVALRYRGRLSLPVAEMAARYEAGEDAHELARVYGTCHLTMLQRLRSAGVAVRRRGMPFRSTYGYRPGASLYVGSEAYLLTFDRAGEGCAIHRACWEAHHGPIPTGYIIHHINGDPTDNRVENLACMTNGEHRTLHNLARRRA